MMMGISYQPPSVEQYTQDMNARATQIKAGQPTTACSPEVAAQAAGYRQGFRRGG